MAALMALVSGATAAPETPPAAPPAVGCPRGTQSSLAEISCEVRRALPQLPASTLVVSGPLGGDTRDLKQPDALATKLARVVAGALGARSSDQVGKLATARALASRVGSLLFLSPEIRAGELLVNADLYPVPRGFWDRVRDPEPNPRAHAFASRRLDAEVMSFFPPIPLVASRVDKAVSPEPALALACNDVDLDGSLELLVVGRRGVELGRLRKGRFSSLASARWKELSPIAQSPLKQPIGSAAIEPGRFIDVGISDRARAVRFDPGLRRLEDFGRRIPWPGGGCSRFVGLMLSGRLEPCASGDQTPDMADYGFSSDAVGGALIVDRGGQAHRVRAARLAGEPVVMLKDDRGRSAKLEGVGAQIGVGDLDADGEPEIVASTNSLEPKSDALIAWTWKKTGQLVERFRLAVPSGVRAIAVCPAESRGMAPVAVASGSELWVVR